MKLPSKLTLHLAPVNRGPFNCLPARPVELEPERIRIDCDDATPCIHPEDHGNASLYVVGNEYGPMGAVWCRNEGDAIDALVNADLAGGILIDEDSLARMDEEEKEDVHYAGNAGEPVDLTHAWIQRVELDGARDWRLIAMLAEARGANVSHLGEL